VNGGQKAIGGRKREWCHLAAEHASRFCSGVRHSPRAEELQARLVRLGEQYHHVESLCNAHEQSDLPFSPGPADRFGYPQAEKLAHQFRQLLGLGERPGQALLRVLEEVCKIKVFHLEFEPSGTAACTLSESFGAAILLNARTSAGGGTSTRRTNSCTC